MSSWSIRKQIYLLLSIPLVCLFALGGFSWILIDRSRDSVDEISNKTIPSLVAAAQTREQLILGLRYLNGAMMSDGEQQRKFLGLAEGSLTELKMEVANLVMAIEDTPHSEKAAHLEKHAEVYIREVAGFINQSLLSEIQRENVDASVKHLTSGALEESKQELLSITSQFQSKLKASSLEDSKDLVAQLSNGTSLMLGLFLFGVVLSASLGLILVRAINHVLTQTFERISKSNSEVKLSASALKTSSEALSGASSESAASLEESVASMHEISRMIQENTKESQTASGFAETMREQAAQSQAQMTALVQNMDLIERSSAKIKEILVVIDDIAFQTNLLALNAAVEAARAGEQGRGFAIVAEAVRTLAQKSATSAKEISELIKSSSSQINEGSQLTKRNEEFLRSLVDQIEKFHGSMQAISQAASEQNLGVQQVSKAFHELDQAVQSNAATSEEVAATSAQLQGLVDGMQTAMADLELLIKGRSKGIRGTLMSVEPATTLVKHTNSVSTKTDPTQDPFWPERKLRPGIPSDWGMQKESA